MSRVWVESIERGTAKTGNEFLKVQCVLDEDRRSRQFYLWDQVPEFSALYDQGVRCFECMFGGDANFPKISSFEQAIGEATEFYSFIYPNDEHARRVFESLKATITDPFYCEIINRIFDLPGTNGFARLVDSFCIIPAAKAFHHNFRYGLLRHTHEVMSFVSRICDAELLNKNLDKQTALCGAFLHDVGKCYEYSFDGVNSAGYGTSLQENQIYLASHLYKGAELVEVAFQRLISEDAAWNTEQNNLKKEHLKHIILSHHLQREWAAVSKAPQTLEAYLVFLADYYSAAMGKFEAIDWSNVSATNLYGETSKYDSFFGFTPLLKTLVENPVD